MFPARRWPAIAGIFLFCGESLPARPLVLPPAPQEGVDRVQINVNDLGQNVIGDAAQEPSLAVDPTDPTRLVVGWSYFPDASNADSESAWAYSHDGGRTWDFQGLQQPAGDRGEALVRTLADGTVLYWSQGPSETELYISRVSGVSWSSPIGSAGGDDPFAWVDRSGGPGDGNIYLTWTPDTGCCGNANFVRSEDGGFTTSTPLELDLAVGGITVGRNGEVYVAGVPTSPLDFETIRIAKSINAQLPGSTPTFGVNSTTLGGSLTAAMGPNPGGVLGKITIDTDTSNGPHGGNVYLLACVDPDGPDPGELHFSRSTDGGLTWSAPRRINDEPFGRNAFQWLGTMSVAPNGRIDAVWYDTRNSVSGIISELFYSFSIDGGQTWAVNEAISPPFNHFLGQPGNQSVGDHIDIESDNLGVHVIYTASFNSEQDLYYLRLGARDCNGNGNDDLLDVGVVSVDNNNNGVPDECETLLLQGFSPGIVDTVNFVHVTRATPTSLSFLLTGTTLGTLVTGGCGIELGFLDPVVLSPLVSNGRGEITFGGSIDSSLSGTRILFQVIEPVSCRSSEVLDFTFP